MASLQKTYSGDLTQSIARRLSAIVASAAGDAATVRNDVEKHIIAQNLKAPDRPFDPQFRRTLKLPFGFEIKGGDYFGQALRHKFTPNPLGFFGSRFQKKPFSEVVQHPFFKGQSYPFSSPVGPFKTNAATQAKLAGQPFHNVAAGADLKYQKPITRGASYGPVLPSLQGTGKGQAIEVKDPKLGKFFTAVSRSLSASILGMTEKMDSNEESLISAKDGILGTVKKLEYSSQTLEDKLDAIIKALREQNRNAFIAEDNKEAARTDANVKLQKIQYEGEVTQKKDEDDAEFAIRDAIDEAQDEDKFSPYPTDTGDMWRNKDVTQLARGGIVDGPQSGYPAILHGREAVIPLDTPFTRQNYAAGTLGVNKPLTNTVMRDETTAPSFEKFVPNMFKQIIESKVTDLPNIKETTEMLGKAVELPVKASGLVAFNVLGKALSGMKTLAGDVTTPLKQVLSPLTAFGVQNNVINSLTRDLNVGGAAVKRQERNKQLGADQKQGNMLTRFFNKIMSIVNPPPPPDNKDNKKDGEGGPGYVGGGAKYVGGGNVFEGAKNWWNRGRNVRVGGENTARWFGKGGLLADDAKQLTRTNKAFKSGAGGIKGWRPLKAFTPDMVKTGPTPAVRQAFERPIRSVKGLGTVKGGLVTLILNELMNPAPLADGTLTGNMNVVNSSQFNRTDRTDKMNNFVELRSIENQISKINNFEAQQSKIIQINNGGVTTEEKESSLNHIANNPDTTMDVFFPSPYNY
jgi:hypothetical protein